MTDRPQPVRGLGYVPGQASGMLVVDPAQAGPGNVLLVGQQQIDVITAPPAGIIVREGAPLAHRMIRLLGMGVPTVLVDAGQAARLRPGQTVQLDGASGVIRTGPPPAQPAPAPTAPTPGQAVCTADGAPVQLLASVRNAAAAKAALAAGACDIGLVRSEFLQPASGQAPDESYYTRTLGELCAAAAPLTVSIRLIDTSPDKRPAWLPDIPGFGATLGLQGARLFDNPAVRAVVRAQLGAIAALAERHRLQVIIPYLTRYEELQRHADWVREQLPATIPVGAMVETPAAALDLTDWLAVADFVAVGCNDLMQGLFAADRDRPELAGFLDPYTPVLFRLLGQMAQAAGEQLHRVRLCGVLPQLPGVLPVLTGLGYRAFSVDAVHIPYLADSVRRVRLAGCGELASRVRAERTAAAVRALVHP